MSCKAFSFRRAIYRKKPTVRGISTKEVEEAYSPTLDSLYYVDSQLLPGISLVRSCCCPSKWPTTSKFASAHICHALYHIGSCCVARKYACKISFMVCLSGKISLQSKAVMAGRFYFSPGVLQSMFLFPLLMITASQELWHLIQLKLWDCGVRMACGRLDLQIIRQATGKRAQISQRLILSIVCSHEL